MTMVFGEQPLASPGSIPKNVGDYYIMNDMDIYYLHLIMDCHWRSAGSGENLKHWTALLLQR